MKKHLLLLSLSVVFYISKAQTVDAGRTVGSIDVSPTGAATYTVPIAVPPGIGGVVPQVALVYNSQGGNGIAGYGWNISGLSSISRIAATKFHDGYVGAVNNNLDDRLSLDGQRLILKSGANYWAMGAEFQTENYSNIRIVRLDVGFEVYYPDGSKSGYGRNLNSITPTDYAITYSTNPQGLRIDYVYTISNNTIRISQIKYGSTNESTHINQVNFLYKDVMRTEQVYIPGLNIFRDKILSEINVIGNGVNFRNYVLTHDEVGTLKYERLIKLQEFSGDNSKVFEPILFNYLNTNSSLSSNLNTNTGFTSGLARNNAKVVTSDFTGDGKMDFILYPNDKSKLWLSWKLFGTINDQLQAQFNTSFEEIFPVNYLYHTSTSPKTPGILLIKYVDQNIVKFDIKSLDNSTQTINNQYIKEWDAPLTNGFYSECTESYTPGIRIPREFLSGDFNGDGLTDIISVSKPYNETTYGTVRPDCDDTPEYCCDYQTQYNDISFVHFINLDRRAIIDFVNVAGLLTKSYSGNDKLIAADFNGDGKTDIAHITEGKVYVYTLSTSNTLSLLWQTPDSRFKMNHVQLVGDFNGDGKTDLMVANDLDSGDEYSVFMSTGNQFNKFERTFPFVHEPYEYDGYDQIATETMLTATDINFDGKSDIIRTKTVTKNNKSGAFADIILYQNTGMEAGGTAPIFVDAGYKSVSNFTFGHQPIPVFLGNDKPNFQMEVGLFSHNSLLTFTCQKNLQEDVQLRSIVQDGVSYSMEYKSMVDDNINSLPIYTRGSNQIFPNVDIENRGLKLVSKLTKSFNNSSTQQVFSYREAATNMEGLGFLGFREVIKSNWSVGESDPNRLLSISINDQQRRGALLQQFTSKYPYVSSLYTDVTAPEPYLVLSAPSTGTKTASQSITMKPGFEANGSAGTFIAKISDPSNPINDGASSSTYITRTDYTYDTELLPNKVFINKQSSVITTDKLSGTSTTVAFTYDTYNNVIKEQTNYSGAGTKTVDITYGNNPVTTGYYIGRPLTKKTLLNNLTDTYGSEEQYTYTGFLPTEIKKKGHNTPFVTESLQYDTYGNVTQKTLTTASGSRSGQMQYDASGRFMTKSIDSEGLETTYQYNLSTGNPISKTDPFNITSTFEYDIWGRLTKSTNPVEKSSFTKYEKSGAYIKISNYDDAGSSAYKLVNALGQTTEASERNVLGQWVCKSYQYDLYGRLQFESEPTIGYNFYQKNETVYDEYGRVKKLNAFTGKSTTITYNGLSTSVNDGTKTVTSLKNALGQTASVTDPGGTIINTYYANGNLKSANFEGSIQSIEQDGWGRKTKLTDPSAGVYTYAYNGFGEITTESNPKGSASYTYDTNGKLLSKQITGDATNMGYQYTYDGTTKLLSSLNLTNTDGNNAVYSYSYDTYKRLSSVVEDNTHAKFTKAFTYDSYSRIATENSEAINKRNNKSTVAALRNEYQYGSLKRMFENSDLLEKIWEVSEVNARGQVTNAQLGSTILQSNIYNDYGFPQQLKTERYGNSPAVLMQLGYNFDILRGNLNTRSNSAFGWTESFAYDNLDRLTSFNDNSGNHSQSYDARGRIDNNSTIGNYTFSNGYSYQHIGLTSLTPQAITHYKALQLQEVSYNAFKSPVQITETGKEKISFQYNAAQGRSHMYYGDEQADKISRRFRRHYSEDGSMEITEDMQTGTTSFVFYMGGDAYSAPAMWKEVQSSTSTTQNLYYLHRDHLGSILMITDILGEVKEKRQFDAWGNLVKLEDGSGNALASFVITDRGYTGHEHLMGVGLIHMNGRLYDPKLHRFLQPDNFVQDPTNTQNFNRYAYVLNNPLKFTDPSGEFLLAFLLLTEKGYDIQKHISPVAVHIDLKFGSQQKGIGFDVSVGVPKALPLSYRYNYGQTYYWKNYDVTPGWERRTGGEVSYLGLASFGSTHYDSPGTEFDQTIGNITLGIPGYNLKYENDWQPAVFNKLSLGLIPTPDGGDRSRTAALKLQAGPFSAGFNLFTGDPGLNDADRRTQRINGRDTYVKNPSTGDDPDKYRAGVGYVGFGPFRIGVNSEGIRHQIQNRITHDGLQGGRTPWFRVLSIRPKFYFNFGFGGSSLW
ncbi:MAG: VCBS repeat-containing protein [Sphingobacteriaceae bacterium]|nr:VCBS repeat-containing protein [Sphingobacteriaceae bacterium]